MELLYITWGYPWDDAIIRAFEGSGITVRQLALPAESEAEHILKQQLRDHDTDLVFSVNFFKCISHFCQQEQFPYASWVLSLPNFDLYTDAVWNPCNYIGICDSYLTEQLLKKGIRKVYFLPDAIEAPVTSALDTVPLYREACFIGDYPQQTLKLHDLPLYSRGYVEAFLHAQRVLPGIYILEDGLLGRVYQDVSAVNSIPDGILPDFHKLYLADYYLAPSCTALQQTIFIQNYENIITIYSDSDFSRCRQCSKLSFPADPSIRNRIYAEKEFTVVLASHVLHNGIPRQTLEVIVAGGFPICAMQKDYSYFFKEGESLACFHDSAEFNRLVVAYGNDPEKREHLRRAAYQLVTTHHTYNQRISSMLHMWETL